MSHLNPRYIKNKNTPSTVVRIMASFGRVSSPNLPKGKWNNPVLAITIMNKRAPKKKPVDKNDIAMSMGRNVPKVLIPMAFLKIVMSIAAKGVRRIIARIFSGISFKLKISVKNSRVIGTDKPSSNNSGLIYNSLEIFVFKLSGSLYVNVSTGPKSI